eukprot:CAMPEP_0206194990 /NCGR_PEP_ID=MMETSP0166-20121206/7548_1 /ASSEMBLY_ACC=CAM_ASM_000260 /TAXON_ID=95228 /ORGANISM="Vannella robusta, Strain DIVA3 518/3/11/1/6" /LENGTH=190 /DNA_ID=CAMNT_0053612113 /DNA_START=1064 /DNA_END=1636 /DNA_ORIENTATION=-
MIGFLHIAFRIAFVLGNYALATKISGHQRNQSKAMPAVLDVLEKDMALLRKVSDSSRIDSKWLQPSQPVPSSQLDFLFQSPAPVTPTYVPPHISSQVQSHTDPVVKSVAKSDEASFSFGSLLQRSEVPEPPPQLSGTFSTGFDFTNSEISTGANLSPSPTDMPNPSFNTESLDMDSLLKMSLPDLSDFLD